MTPNAIAEAKRCGKRHIRTIVAMVVVLLCAVRLSAQEVDFLKYKFYEDDYTETLLLLQEDTITSPLSSRNTYHVIPIGCIERHVSLHHIAFATTY